MDLSETSPEHAYSRNATAAHLDPDTSYFEPTDGYMPCRRKPGTKAWRKKPHINFFEEAQLRDAETKEQSVLANITETAWEMYNAVTSPWRTASRVVSGVKSAITDGIASTICSTVSSVYETLVPQMCRDAISSSNVVQFSRFWWNDWDTRAWMRVVKSKDGTSEYVKTVTIDKASTQASDGKFKELAAVSRSYTSPWVVSAVKSSKLAAETSAAKDRRESTASTQNRPAAHHSRFLRFR